MCFSSTLIRREMPPPELVSNAEAFAEACITAWCWMSLSPDLILKTEIPSLFVVPANKDLAGAEIELVEIDTTRVSPKTSTC